MFAKKSPLFLSLTPTISTFAPYVWDFLAKQAAPFFKSSGICYFKDCKESFYLFSEMFHGFF
jgi:hypothetical protein